MRIKALRGLSWIFVDLSSLKPFSGHGQNWPQICCFVLTDGGLSPAAINATFGGRHLHTDTFTLQVFMHYTKKQQKKSCFLNQTIWINGNESKYYKQKNKQLIYVPFFFPVFFVWIFVRTVKAKNSKQAGHWPHHENYKRSCCQKFRSHNTSVSQTWPVLLMFWTQLGTP